jgi:non-ribosomal peptide synthetase component F
LSPSQDELLGIDHVPAPQGADGHEQDVPASTPSTYRPRDNARPSVKELRLPPSLTANLRDRARQEGTTVHGALCASLALAGRQVSADWRDIVSPINTRPTLGVGEDCGVFLSAAASVFEVGATGFWELARHAKASVAAGQARDSIEARMSRIQQAVGGGPDVAAAAEFASIAFARQGMMTNLGPLPFASQFGALKLKALWGPAVLAGFVGEQTIGVATVDGSLYLTHTSHTPPTGLLEAMQSVLVDACST